MAGAAFGWLQPLRATLDIVFVDQRGTGQSHPLQCSSAGDSDPAAVFGHVFDPAVVARCREALSRDADLTKYTTDDAIADVDDVRAALGYERVSLYGGSYGTRMAQAYMRRFPSRVRSAVIDGVVPFDNAIPLTYAASAQQSVERVWAACAADAGCQRAHPHLSADFERLLRRLDAGPVPTTLSAAGRPVTVAMHRGDFGYAVRGLLYNANAVSRLPDMIGRAAATGDFREFARLLLVARRDDGPGDCLRHASHACSARKTCPSPPRRTSRRRPPGRSSGDTSSTSIEAPAANGRVVESVPMRARR